MFFKKKLIVFVALFSVCFNCSTVAAYESESINIGAKSAIVMDINTGEVLYEKDSKDKTQIASTTKIMTALILAENRLKTDLIRFTENAMSQPSSSLYKDVAFDLTTDDYLTADNAMKGLLMASGNDMAVIIAEDIAGTEESFSKIMDKKAIEIGMKDSDFYTASGLDTDDVLKGENHYSTAYDMALLGIAAYNNSWVKENMGVKSATIGTNDGYMFSIENSNKNLGKNNCVGGKTGYTTKAQRCLVAFYENDERSLVGVVLGGGNPSYFEDMNNIMEYSLNVKPTLFKENNAIIGTNSFSYKKYDVFSKLFNVEFPMVLRENTYIYDNEFNKKNTTYNVHKNNVSIWDLDKESIVGVLEIEEPNRINKYNLYLDGETIEYITLCKSRVLKLAYIGIIVIACCVYFIFIKKTNETNLKTK